MESEGDEASHQHPKRSKLISSDPFSSSSIEDSSYKPPVLPAALINDILLKLPVKSLVRFKCVETSWLGLISSPKFVKTHLSISANKMNYTCHRLMLGFDPPKNNLKDCSVSSLLYDDVTRAMDLDSSPKRSHQSIKVVGSVNGLICVAIEERDLFLWNPSIRKLKKLPSSRTDCFYMYGFGYDELHDDYKVVAMSQYMFGNSRYSLGKIYSLNDNSWKRLDHFKTGRQFNSSGMFVNGKLHWAIIAEHYRFYRNYDIIFVDLADGRWGKIEKPCYGEGNFDFWPCLGVLGNDLSMFCHHLRSHTDVWVMKEYGVKESWTKMFIIKFPCDPVWYRMFGPPICMSSEGEFLFKNGSVFTIYNPNDESMRFPKVTNCNHLLEANIYIESLVWPFVAEGTRDATTSKVPKAQRKTIV